MTCCTETADSAESRDLKRRQAATMVSERRDEAMNEEYTCPVCLEIMIEPTSACADGHACCRNCHVSSLRRVAECVICRHPADRSRLVRSRPLENIINKLRVRCKRARKGGSGRRGKRENRVVVRAVDSGPSLATPCSLLGDTRPENGPRRAPCALSRVAGVHMERHRRTAQFAPTI